MKLNLYDLSVFFPFIVFLPSVRFNCQLFFAAANNCHVTTVFFATMIEMLCVCSLTSSFKSILWNTQHANVPLQIDHLEALIFIYLLYAMVFFAASRTLVLKSFSCFIFQIFNCKIIVTEWNRLIWHTHTQPI